MSFVLNETSFEDRDLSTGVASKLFILLSEEHYYTIIIFLLDD